jgi:hypothetical protein
MSAKAYSGYHMADGHFAPHLEIDLNLGASGSGVGPTYSDAVEVGSHRVLALTLAVAALSADDTLSVTLETSATGAPGTWYRAQGGAAPGGTEVVGGFTQVAAASVPAGQSGVFITDKFVRAAYTGGDAGTTYTCTLTGTAA